MSVELFVQIPDRFIANGRPATTDDVVAWLTEHGAEIEGSFQHEVWHYGEWPILQMKEPGRYLVYKLPE